MNIQHLSLNDITIDPRLQMRVEMNDEALEDYASKLDSLPPVQILRDDDGVNWLTDGYHTYYAHKNAKATSIRCCIMKGTFRDALIDAAGANAEHGIPTTKADKRKKVETLLAYNGFAEMSNRALAAICKVSDHFVESVRLTFKPNDNSGAHTRTQEEEEQRTGKDGRKQASKKGGKRAEKGLLPCSHCIKRHFTAPNRKCPICMNKVEKSEKRKVIAEAKEAAKKEKAALKGSVESAAEVSEFFDGIQPRDGEGQALDTIRLGARRVAALAKAFAEGRK